VTRTPLITIKHPQYPAFRVLLHAYEIRGIVVPRGFVWDGCSHPSATRWMLGDPFDGPLRDAPLLHDYLYETQRVPREIADELFHRQLLADGAGRVRAGLMWAAVRVAASGHYKRSSDWPKFILEDTLTSWAAAVKTEVLPLFSVDNL
jgi:hypothetical protein